MQPWLVAVLVTAAAALGLVSGLFLDAETLTNSSIANTAKLHINRLQSYVRTVPQPTTAVEQHVHRVLGGEVWHHTMWGKACASKDNLTVGQQALCHLPTVWKDCTQCIYLDIVSIFCLFLYAAATRWQQQQQ